MMRDVSNLCIHFFFHISLSLLCSTTQFTRGADDRRVETDEVADGKYAREQHGSVDSILISRTTLVPDYTIP